jgi:hypothetical protein
MTRSSTNSRRQKFEMKMQWILEEKLTLLVLIVSDGKREKRACQFKKDSCQFS